MPSRISSIACAPELDAFISMPASLNRAWPVIVWDWPAESDTVSKLKVPASRIAAITEG